MLNVTDGEAVLAALLLLISLLTPIALIVVLVVLLRRPATRSVDWSTVQDPVLHRWRLATVVVSVAALVLAVLTTVVVAQTDDLGRGVLLAPVVFALVHAVGIAVTQPLLARWRGRAGDVREASLETRRASTYSSGGRVALAVTGVVALAALSAVGWALGRPDDMGRAGRALRYGAENSSGSTGPWPGSFYVVPLLILAAVLVVVTLLALRLVADRPRPRSVDGATLAADDALRASASGRLLAGLSVGTLGSAAGVALGTAMAFRTVIVNSSDGQEPAIEGLGHVEPWTVTLVALIVALALVVLACAALLQLVVPARPGRPATPAHATTASAA